MSEPTNEELAATFESYVGRISGYPHGWNTLAGLLKIAASRLRSLSPQAEFPAPAAPVSGEPSLMAQLRTPRDWKEDFEHENGNYFNWCCHCGMQFIGHKRRIACWACAHPVEAIATLTAENAKWKTIISGSEPSHLAEQCSTPEGAAAFLKSQQELWKEIDDDRLATIASLRSEIAELRGIAERMAKSLEELVAVDIEQCDCDECKATMAPLAEYAAFTQRSDK